MYNKVKVNCLKAPLNEKSAENLELWQIRMIKLVGLIQDDFELIYSNENDGVILNCTKEEFNKLYGFLSNIKSQTKSFDMSTIKFLKEKTKI